jgi:hypothetical protein
MARNREGVLVLVAGYDSKISGSVAHLFQATRKHKIERDLNRHGLDASLRLTDMIALHARGVRMSRGCHALRDMRSEE